MTEKLWEANSLRLTLFNQENVPAERSLFKEIFGEEPDIKEVRAKEGFAREEGDIGEYHVGVFSSPIRIDVMLFLSATKVEASAFAPEVKISIGPFSEVLPHFVAPIQKWLPNAGIKLNRIAFSGVVFAMAEDAAQTYEILRAQLKSVRVMKEMSDLNFRVNWRRKTKTTKSKYLNRLATWSANRFTLAAGAFGEVKLATTETFAARLDFDISTPAEDTGALRPSVLVPIFQEMVHLAGENVMKGEVK